jgi:hypothetical protein
MSDFLAHGILFSLTVRCLGNFCRLVLIVICGLWATEVGSSAVNCIFILYFVARMDIMAGTGNHVHA